MYKILTLNKISTKGLSNFDSTNYTCSSEFDSPDAIIVRSASMHGMKIPDSVVAVARAGAGVNNIPVDELTKKGIVVFNTPGANANAVKELVICALFLTSRRIMPAISWCCALKGCGSEVSKLVEKEKSNYAGPEIMGKTLGIVGLGAIGVMVANTAIALGMQVTGYDPYLTDKAAANLNKKVKITANLDDLYSESDYISLHAPLCDTTRGCINSDAFLKMKDGVRILNFARAELVNEDDIIEALKSGKCSAYATDFPTDSQLGIDGVIAIPHLGASTPESEENCAKMAVVEIREFLENGTINNSVNFPNVELPLNEDSASRLSIISEFDISKKINDYLEQKNIKVISSVTKEKTIAYSIFETATKISDEILENIRNIESILRVRLI